MRRPIIEKFTLETLDEVLQVGSKADLPNEGVAVLGALSPEATVYVDGEVRGQYVDTDVDVDHYINYATGEEHTVYGARRVNGQRVLK